MAVDVQCVCSDPHREIGDPGRAIVTNPGDTMPEGTNGANGDPWAKPQPQPYAPPPPQPVPPQWGPAPQQYGPPQAYAPPPNYGPAPGYGPPQSYGIPPYGYPGYGPGPTRGTNGMAIASMVLGILWLWWIGSVLALIFGYVARSQIRERYEGGNGMAVAGIVLGWIGVGTFVLVVILAAAGHA
jgi:hypothetical protein